MLRGEWDSRNERGVRRSIVGGRKSQMFFGLADRRKGARLQIVKMSKNMVSRRGPLNECKSIVL